MALGRSVARFNKVVTNRITRHLAGRESTEAHEGIAAFNAKRPPPWAPSRSRPAG